MIARAGSGWQTVLADLSLILFMVMASAVSAGSAKEGETARISPSTQPLALWRAGDGMPALADWLASEGADPRLQLTIVAHYASGGLGAALEQASTLARQARDAGMSARVVVEPGEAGIVASLAYDRPGATDPRKNNGTQLALPDQ